MKFLKPTSPYTLKDDDSNFFGGSPKRDTQIFFFLGFRSHPMMLQGESWLCAKASLLQGSASRNGCWEAGLGYVQGQGLLQGSWLWPQIFFCLLLWRPHLAVPSALGSALKGNSRQVWGPYGDPRPGFKHGFGYVKVSKCLPRLLLLQSPIYIYIHEY